MAPALHGRYGDEVLRCVIAAVLVALALAWGCTANDVIDVTFDPCSPLVITPAAGTTAAEVESIEAAIAAWSGVVPTSIEIGTDAADPLVVAFESGDTFYRATYWDKIGEVSISRDKLADEDYALAIAHELGHAFGLFHVPVDERASVMNVHNLAVAPNAADGLALRELWDACRAGDVAGFDAGQ